MEEPEFQAEDTDRRDSLVRKASEELSNDAKGEQRRKRSFSQLLEDDLISSMFPDNENDEGYEDEAEGDNSSDEDGSIIVTGKTLHDNRNTETNSDSQGSSVPIDIELLSDEEEESELESDEDLEREEIEILSETKLDKAELIRREQQFKKLTCPVCLDAPDVIVATQCGHLFCCECIIKSLASSKTKSIHSGVCPVCRKNVRYKDLQLLSIKQI